MMVKRRSSSSWNVLSPTGRMGYYCFCLVVLLALLLQSSSSAAFCSPPLKVVKAKLSRNHHTSSSCIVIGRASSSRDNDDSHQDGTLYDILGASPTDSQQQLKLRYTTLAKKLHPDASVGKPNTTTNDFDFRDVNAAWRVLADPKERLRYDRSLQAKKFTDNMETLLEEGIKNAVPFLRKTADSTRAAVETMGDAFGRMEVETRIRDMEQQATRDKVKAGQMKTQLETIGERGLEILANKEELTAMEASRILDSFDVEESRLAEADIQALRDVETEYREKLRERQESEKALRSAEKSVGDAVRAEERAVQRLADAKRLLAETKESLVANQKSEKEATVRDKAATIEFDKVSAIMDRKQDKLKSSLRKKQEESMQREATYLKKQVERLEKKAGILSSKARAMRLDAEEEMKRKQ